MLFVLIVIFVVHTKKYYRNFHTCTRKCIQFKITLDKHKINRLQSIATSFIRKLLAINVYYNIHTQDVTQNNNED